MVHVTRAVKVLIHAPLQTVFDYVSDLTKHPEWSEGELKIEAATPGPVVVGKDTSPRARSQHKRTARIQSEFQNINRRTNLGLSRRTQTLETFRMFSLSQSRMTPFWLRGQ